MEFILDLGLSNYYGEVSLWFDGEEQYYLKLDDWDYPSEVPISQEFAKAVIKEFGREDE